MVQRPLRRKFAVRSCYSLPETLPLRRDERNRFLDEERAAGLVTDSIYESSVTDVQRRALEELAIDEKHVKRTPPLGKAFAVGL